MENLYDVYIWPLNDVSDVKLVAKNVKYDTAMKYFDHYFNTNLFDAYIVAAGTEFIR